MSGAEIADIADVVGLVMELAPQLMTDVQSLSTLYSNASHAVQNAAADGTVSAADWEALLTTERDLKALLAQEASDAEKAADAGAETGASQPPASSP